MLMPHLLRGACTLVANPRFKAAAFLSEGFAAAERIADNLIDPDKQEPA
jgi:hypothetical protein